MIYFYYSVIIFFNICSSYFAFGGNIMKNLKKLRETHGLSQQKFANIFSLSQQSVYKYENDISEPNLQTLTEIADYFNTSVDYLIDHTDNSSPADNRMEDSLTFEEKELIEHYRRLSTNYKSIITMLIDTHLRELH